MHRFWIFPLILGLVGAFEPTLTMMESVAPTLFRVLYTTGAGSSFMWDALAMVWRGTVLWGVLCGAILGLGAAFVDRLKNGGRDRRGTAGAGRLLGNVWWCGLYAFAVVALNGALVAVCLRSLFVTGSFVQPTLYNLLQGYANILPKVLNLVALLCAAIYTANAPDILSPRVLLTKARRSAKLEG